MNVLEQLERAAQLPDDHRYLLIEELGRGGMGRVWLAEKLGPNGEPFCTVVLKTILLPHGAASDDIQRRKDMFMREMAVAAKLRHPNIVGVTNWGTDLFGSEIFIEMERIRGVSLLALLAARGVPLDADEKWGPLPPGDVAWIGMQAATGLHHAHSFLLTGEDDTEGGVVHRDVTPDNIMVDVAGDVRVADWGITKPLSADGDASKTGTIAGKIRYMAPEQLVGDIDARVDVYGLGLTLLVALSGKHPFPDPGEVGWDGVAFRVHKGERPTVAELAPDAPPELAMLLERMIAPKRDRRPSMSEVIEPFADLAVRFGGRLDKAQHAFAARVREHHKEGRRTKRALQAAHDDVPSKSTRRPISAQTRQDAPTAGSSALAHPSHATAPLATASPPFREPTAALTPGSALSLPAARVTPPARPRWLVPALASATLLVTALLAFGIAFLVGGRRDSAEERTPSSADSTAATRPNPSTQAPEAAETPAASPPPQHSEAAGAQATEAARASEAPPATPPGTEDASESAEETAERTSAAPVNLARPARPSPIRTQTTSGSESSSTRQPPTTARRPRRRATTDDFGF